MIRTKIENLIARKTQRFDVSKAFRDAPKSGMDRETVLRKIGQVPFWWHTIEVGHGLVTPGHARYILPTLHMPADLTGKAVLDIGAWDGFYSFEAEKRSASRVMAIDNFYRLQKEGKSLDRGATGLETAREILASKVEFKELSAEDVSVQNVGRFDVVLFLGVFYHLKNPFLVLERLAEITGEMMILESHCERIAGGKPVAVFYAGTEVNKDPTNWWGTNRVCMERMVISAGFARVKCMYQFGDRIVLHAFKK